MKESEAVPHLKLNSPRPESADGTSELKTTAPGRGRQQTLELGMVQDVRRVEPQIEVVALTEVEAPQEADVEVARGWARKDVASEIAGAGLIGPLREHRPEHRGVEEEVPGDALTVRKPEGLDLPWILRCVGSDQVRKPRGDAVRSVESNWLRMRNGSPERSVTTGASCQPDSTRSRMWTRGRPGSSHTA